MDIKKIKKKIRDEITVERVIIAVGAIITYSYVMEKRGYRMVKPAYNSETHAVFNRPFGGTTAVHIQK